MARKVLLSIDMDWFYRELPEWDWGHSESPVFLSEPIWLSRYQMLDVYSECDPMRHADIPPMFFVNALQKKGFKLTKKTRIGGSWSHSDAYEFFKDSGAKVLFNFDAHHDLFSEDELDCGNWLYHLQRDDKLAEVVWVVPKWSEGLGWYGSPAGPIEVKHWEDLRDEEFEVEAVFIAQSPAWSPPHFDEEFGKLIGAFMAHAKKKKLDYPGKYALRPYPTKREAEHMLESWKELRKKLAAQGAG